MVGRTENVFEENTGSVALLVDGENLSSDHAIAIWKIAEKAGHLRVRRVYGSLPKCKEWAAAPGFRFFTPGTGKNSADLLLTVDAMELACTGVCETFVIASSDGDFVHLSDRLRERGHRVIGVGLAKAPDRFRRACTSFRELPETRTATATPRETTTQNGQAPSEMDHLIRTEISKYSQGGAGILVSALSNVMYKEHGVRISEMPERNWRGYLGKRPSLYSLDPRGPDQKVRFLKDGFGVE